MRVASALVSGQRPGPELAAEAVRQALAEAGLKQAEQVILLLSRDFIRHAPPAILAAARAAGCLQIGGGTANGLFTERGWQCDQPAAAALVFAADSPTFPHAATPTLCFSGHGALPFEWQRGQPRAGLLDIDAAVWSHGRLCADGCAEFSLPGLHSHLALSTGLRCLGEAQPVEHSEAYELCRVGGHSAVDSLCRVLPPELRDNPPFHHIAVLRQPGEPATPILSANADGSLTMAAMLEIGEKITWTLRQPLAAEQEMRKILRAVPRDHFRPGAVNGEKAPDFALMFSCIGRGPLFYGDDDHDLQAFREQFPGTPLLGAYGSGQIVPGGSGNHLFQNSVLTLLFASHHV